MTDPRFDTAIMVDWSAAARAPRKPAADAIWAGVARGAQTAPPAYLGTRTDAEGWLADMFDDELSAGRRVVAGFDFPFGYPRGFAAHVVGRPDPLALWDWLEARIEDGPGGNNRIHVAGALNRLFPGVGPFWGNGTRFDVPDLPRKGRARTFAGLPERRLVEEITGGTFTCWQLFGAGAVGSQVLMGLPVLTRLRRRFAGRIAVWPFEPLSTPIALVEIWPSLLKDAVNAALQAEGGIKDAHQVRLTAAAIAALAPSTLGRLLDVSAPEEGWILGAEHPGILRSAVS